MVEDLESHVLDIGVRIKTNLSTNLVMLHHQEATDEYEKIRVVPFVDLKRFVEARSTEVVGVSRILIDKYGSGS